MGPSSTTTAQQTVYTCPAGFVTLVKHLYLWHGGGTVANSNFQHVAGPGLGALVFYQSQLIASTLVAQDLEVVMEGGDYLTWYYSDPSGMGELGLYGSVLVA